MSELPTSAADANSAGLEHFAAGDSAAAELLLRQAYRLMPEEPAILVNLGLSLMQQALVEPAERCYRLALKSTDQRTRCSAAKNLGFLLLWSGQFAEGWHWHGQRFAGEAFEANQWRGEPLNGQALTVWNDVGMGDAFQFVRYTLPLVQRGERVRWAVDRSQIALFQQRLAWPLEQVVNRSTIDRTAGPHIPLMSLIALLDPSTQWGRSFQLPTWTTSRRHEANAIGLCWASNPADRTMHRYKSCRPERLLQLAGDRAALCSLQTDEPEAHRRLGLAAPIRNWLQTLDRLSGCRRVISVDTAVAHLAAGSGLPLTLLLSQPPDWRWRRFSPSQPLWYPSLHIAPLAESAHPAPASTGEPPGCGGG